MRTLFTFLFFSLSTLAFSATESGKIYGSKPTAMRSIALKKLSRELVFSTHDLISYQPGVPQGNEIVLLNRSKDSIWMQKNGIVTDSIKSEGYQIIKKNNHIYLIGGDERGLMYGILDLRDQLKLAGNFAALLPKTENPHFPFRAIKFNLPWSSYRIGESLQLKA